MKHRLLHRHPPRLLARGRWMCGAAVLTLCMIAPAWGGPTSNDEVGTKDSAGSDPLSNLLSSGLLGSGSDTSPAQMIKKVGSRASDMASDLVLAAMTFIGVPYKYGGQSVDSGFDCSGFTRYVYEHSVGLVLPRRADEQAHASGMTNVKPDDLQPGDLVFFRTLRHAFSHVGIYVGDHRFIHAPRTGAEVRIEDMQTSYWASRYNGARRPQALGTATVVPPAVPSAAPAASAATGNVADANAPVAGAQAR